MHAQYLETTRSLVWTPSDERSTACDPNFTRSLTFDVEPISSDGYQDIAVGKSIKEFSLGGAKYLGNQVYNNQTGGFPNDNGNFYQHTTYCYDDNRIRDHIFGKLRPLHLVRDLAVLRQDGIRIYYNTGNGMQSPHIQFLPGDALTGTWGVFDQSDSYEDLAVTDNSQIRIYRNLNNGTVDPSPVFASSIPATRLSALARYGLDAKAQALRQMAPDRRLATLLVTVRHLEAVALDDALDLFALLVVKLVNRVERQSLKERLANLPTLDQAAQTLRQAVLAIVEGEGRYHDVAELLATIFAAVPREELLQAAEAVYQLTRSPEDIRAEELSERYGYLRQFLPTMLGTIPFEATEAGQPVLKAWWTLADLEGRRKIGVHEVPTELVTGAWKRLAIDGDQLNKAAYTLCVLEKLREALRRRDVFVQASQRWNDPRTKLLSGAEWEAHRVKVCRSLGLDPDPQVVLATLGHQLDEAYRQVTARLDGNPALQIGPVEGKKGDRPSLEADPALEEPSSLTALREQVNARLPKVDLPELLLEVNAWTGFAAAFTHLSESRSSAEDLPISICAVLTAEACNVGLEPMVTPSVVALTRARLSWIDQNYVRVETIAAANAWLVDYQATIPLAQRWGGGHVASVDGMRFVVPVRTINAGPNPKYFGPGRGVTYLNFVSDQATGFHAIVVPGTLRDALYILDGLLEQNTSLDPRQIVSDTHGYTDIVFGLFRLLGYQFSPRLADLPDQRFWRMEKEADYSKLDQLGRHLINTRLIAAHWDDILRVAGSLETGVVKASDLLRVLQGGGQPTSLGKAIGEVGRIAKTLHLLAYVDDENYRRGIRTQLQLHEARHSLGRVVFHGQKGELRQRYREGQEDQLGALGLVVNAIVLWNTRYIHHALEHLRSTGDAVSDEDVQRLSPLGHQHIHMLGRYQFALPRELQEGQLRPLRDPSRFEE
jgi:TnpA family transposase